MNVPIINAPYRAHPCAGGRHIDLACAKAIKLLRGRLLVAVGILGLMHR